MSRSRPTPACFPWRWSNGSSWIGGEPFLRDEFGAICRQFIRANGVRQIYVPSNGWFTERTIAAVTEVLKEPELDLLVVELSLDGMAKFHDTFRVAPGSLKKAMVTYDALAKLHESDPRLCIHCISTATDVNVEEIRKLTTYLYDRCPKMDHHNLAIIRGDRKNPALKTPPLDEYQALFEYIRSLWQPREEGRYGGIVEPMLQWAKVRTLQERKQVVPCKAGVLTTVISANGDVSICELHEPLGNLRQQSCWEIWNSDKANAMRASVARKECYCTTEGFLWPSIVFQPKPLAQGMAGGRVWQEDQAAGPGGPGHAQRSRPGSRSRHPRSCDHFVQGWAGPAMISASARRRAPDSTWWRELGTVVSDDESAQRQRRRIRAR